MALPWFRGQYLAHVCPLTPTAQCLPRQQLRVPEPRLSDQPCLRSSHMCAVPPRGYGGPCCPRCPRRDHYSDLRMQVVRRPVPSLHHQHRTSSEHAVWLVSDADVTKLARSG